MPPHQPILVLGHYQGYVLILRIHIAIALPAPPRTQDIAIQLVSRQRVQRGRMTARQERGRRRGREHRSIAPVTPKTITQGREGETKPRIANTFTPTMTSPRESHDAGPVLSINSTPSAITTAGAMNSDAFPMSSNTSSAGTPSSPRILARTAGQHSSRSNSTTSISAATRAKKHQRQKACSSRIFRTYRVATIRPSGIGCGTSSSPATHGPSSLK